MEPHRTTASEAASARPPICRPEAHPRPRRADRYPLRAPERLAVEHAAARDGLWFRDDVLAAPRALAAGRRLETVAYGPARRIAPPRRIGSRPRGGRQFLAPCATGGKKTGPNATDRRKEGSKHHI